MPEFNRPLNGKVALVTGAGRGIGRATAMLLAKRGAEVMLLDIEPTGIRLVVDEIVEAGSTAQGFVADVSKIEQVAEAMGDALKRIDILVNNAGISGREAALSTVDEAGYNRMMDIHVKGAFFLTQRIVPNMAARGSGRIINMASNRGMVGYSRSSHYCAAKAALLGLTKSWAREFAPDGILVNAVAPGVVNTEMNTWDGMGPLHEEANLNLLKRWADPIEIAYAVAYLASDEAAFMTGQVISPNGGDPIVGI
jgi:NAD(P)-dependent dehydrogenase (short-subunit alcohol dehydrogenase family)